MKYYVLIIFAILFETYDYYRVHRVQLLSFDYILLKNSLFRFTRYVIIIEFDILATIALYSNYMKSKVFDVSFWLFHPLKINIFFIHLSNTACSTLYYKYIGIYNM